MPLSFPRHRFEATRLGWFLASLMILVLFQIWLAANLPIHNEQTTIKPYWNSYHGKGGSSFKLKKSHGPIKQDSTSKMENSKSRLANDQVMVSDNKRSDSLKQLSKPNQQKLSGPNSRIHKEAAKSFKRQDSSPRKKLDDRTLMKLQNSGVQLEDLDDEVLSKIPSWDVVESVLGSSEPHILGLETCATFQAIAKSSPFRFIGVSGMFNSGTNLLYNLVRNNCIFEAPSDDEEDATFKQRRTEEGSKEGGKVNDGAQEIGKQEDNGDKERESRNEEIDMDHDYEIIQSTSEEIDDDGNQDDDESETEETDDDDETKSEEMDDDGENEDDDESASEEEELESRALFQVPWGKHAFAWQRDTRSAPDYERYNKTQTLVVVSVRNPFHFMESMCRNPYAMRYQKRHSNTTCPHMIDHKSGELIPVSLRTKETPYRFRSIVHYWNYWHRQYMGNFSHPRLFVRMEDLTVHPKETVKAICECAGARVAADEEFKFMISSAKKGLGHGKASELNGLVEAWSRIGRAATFPREDMQAANIHLDQNLLAAFNYRPPTREP